MTFLAMEVDAGASLQDGIADTNAGELGDPGPGVVQRGEHDPIAVAAPPIRRWCVEDRLDLSFREKPEQRLIEPLHRDREYALDARQGGRIFECREVHERSDRRQARIATANGVLAIPLKVIEEGEDERRIDVLQIEVFRRLAGVLMRKLQQQAEAVAVGRYSLWAGVALRDQSFQEERLQDRREAAAGRGGLHETPPSVCDAKR
jgi:hypothetical protein